MSEIDAKSLTAEERAIVDKIAMNYINNDYEPGGEHGGYAQAARQAEPIILARRALFGSPASEPAKAECPNCGEPESEPHTRISADGKRFGGWTCTRALHDCPNCGQPTTGDLLMSDHLCQRPAPPEPAASCRARKGEPCDYNLGGQCIYCREFTPEPAALEMPPFAVIGHDGKLVPETTDASAWAREFVARMENGLLPGPIDDALMIGWFANAIESGRSARLTHAQPVANVAMAPKKLEKVRELIDGVPWKSLDPRDYSAPLAAAIAELNAFERGGREGEG